MNEHDVERERLIPLAEVPSLEWLPRRKGKKIHLSTIHRWAANGARGRKLRTAMVGGCRCTRESWLESFFEELAMPEHEIKDGYRTPTQRARDIAKAERELAADGII